jgi:hypothetical protein
MSLSYARFLRSWILSITPSDDFVFYRDIQMRIGQAMRQHYELPEELPDQLFTLLIQATGLQRTTRRPCRFFYLSERDLSLRLHLNTKCPPSERPTNSIS